MPSTIGTGARKRAARQSASNCVLSPISAAVTTRVERVSDSRIMMGGQEKGEGGLSAANNRTKASAAGPARSHRMPSQILPTRCALRATPLSAPWLRKVGKTDAKYVDADGNGVSDALPGYSSARRAEILTEFFRADRRLIGYTARAARPPLRSSLVDRYRPGLCAKMSATSIFSNQHAAVRLRPKDPTRAEHTRRTALSGERL